MNVLNFPSITAVQGWAEEKEQKKSEMDLYVRIWSKNIYIYNTDKKNPSY